ncbi:nuclear transport factor 2 family protein [Mariniradius sediminis]|uniref:Nuclear transport factor 2 family protein n=1 Tax=Mariniradius sediminis TaxID=2909237 RepID=A0ABS9BQG2_9BACT|nr:nuclear transport factor 2 family protein [Mariniradius sediminis]MCF1749614.1 nuclear transport factor 2 family protein [Mariniradius sediminis]
MRYLKTILPAFFLVSLAAPAYAQEEKEVEKVIASLFEGMKTKNTELLQAAFHPEASMQTVIAGEEGAKLGSNSVQDFVNRISNTPATTQLDERILEYQVKIDGDMAAAWTPYRFYVNDNFSHCGVNSFQLIKTAEGWKITYIIDTRRKQGCD